MESDIQYTHNSDIPINRSALECVNSNRRFTSKGTRKPVAESGVYCMEFHQASIHRAFSVHFENVNGMSWPRVRPRLDVKAWKHVVAPLIYRYCPSIGSTGL